MNPLEVGDVLLEIRYQDMCEFPNPALLDPLDVPVVDLQRDE